MEIARKPRTLTECNCSICRRYAALWAYYTRRAVRMHGAPDAVSAYVCGRRKSFKYFHCRHCGCVTHYERINTKNNDRVAVNARLMELADIASVPIRQFDVRQTT